MVNNDSEYAYNTIFGNDLMYCNEIEQKEIDSVLGELRDGKAIFFESPDLIVVCRTFIISIEHFKVGQSKRTKKGYKFNSKYTDRYLSKKHKNNKVTTDKYDYSLSSERIITDLRYNYMFDNFKNVFMEHYRKVDTYEKNIREKEDISTLPIFNLFLIEYDTILPSYIIKNNDKIPVYIHNDIAFYEFLKDKSDIKGVIISFSDGLKYVSIGSLQETYYTIDNKNVFAMCNENIINFSNPLMTTVIFKENYDKA